MTTLEEPSAGFALRPLPPLPPLPSRAWWRRFTAPSHVSPDAIRTMTGMGYDRAAARRALSRTGNDVQAALELLEEADRSDTKSSMTYSSADSISTGRSDSTPTPTPGQQEYLEEAQQSAFDPISSRRKRFFTLGPLNLPTLPTRSRSTIVSLNRGSGSAFDSETSPTAESVSSASESSCTPTTPFTPLTPTSASTQPMTPPAALSGASTRRRWPLHLSRQERGPQRGVPEWARLWDRKDKDREGECERDRNVSGSSSSSRPGQPASTTRHSIHGGAILPISSLPTRSQSYCQHPPGGHGHSLSLGSERPYMSFSQSIWDGRPNSSAHSSGSSSNSPVVHELAPHQHPFAASLVHCNSQQALWETDLADAASDVGTFGVKQPGEWHWDGCGTNAVDCIFDDDCDDDEDDGVDVEAWRANMNRSTFW